MKEILLFAYCPNKHQNRFKSNTDYMVIFMLFVLSGFFFLIGKRYNIADVSAAMCMSLGLIWFTLADSTVAPNFNLTGKEALYFML